MSNNPYNNCPLLETKSLILRLIKQEDYQDLYEVYHNKKAVEFMNDDNCDFGFYVESIPKMDEVVWYWIDFYNKGYFIRFSIVDKKTNKVIGTIEGFNGDIGVLRVDIHEDYEKVNYLEEIYLIAKEKFNEIFGNKELVTKAIVKAQDRRKALDLAGYTFIDEFRNFKDYYKVTLIK